MLQVSEDLNPKECAALSPGVSVIGQRCTSPWCHRRGGVARATQRTAETAGVGLQVDDVLRMLKLGVPLVTANILKMAQSK